jgi:hypothetical protein
LKFPLHRHTVCFTLQAWMLGQSSI